MKINQLLSGVDIATTNEEQEFLENHHGGVRLTALDDRGQWLAQNLVRKGLFTISKDSNTLRRATKDETSNK